MAKITRFNGNLLAFGINATGTNRTVFGGVTQSDALDDNLNTDYFLGWEIVGVNENPTREDFNALGFTHGQILAYLHQMGVPEWNTNQEYHIGSFASVAGVLYESQTNSNTGNNPTVDSATNWLPLKDNRVTVATITPASDANVTLTRDEYSAEVLVLTDGAWTAARSIIVPNAPRLYWVDNSAGTYTATVKTAAGSGVAVVSGDTLILYCDGVNVIEAVTLTGALAGKFDKTGGEISGDVAISTLLTIAGYTAYHQGNDSDLSVRRLLTDSTGSTYAGQWTKLARVTLDVQYGQVQERLLLSRQEGGEGSPLSAEIEFRVKQQAAFGSDPAIGLQVLDASTPTVRPDDFALVIVQNTPNTIVDLYMRINSGYTSYNGWVSSQSVAGACQHLSNQPFVSTITPSIVGSWNPIGDNAIGTVSQSGGVPTGNIIERGSNANGEYVRFADGTQICTFRGLPSDATTAVGSLFYSGSLLWSFPATFASAPEVSVDAISAQRWGALSAVTTGQATFRQYAPTSSATSIDSSLIAIGRWF